MFEEGLEYIVFVQQFRGPYLDTFFRTVTFLGDIRFYLVFLPFLFWCVDYRLGGRVTITLMVSAYVSFFLKDQLQLPRPINLDPTIQLITEGGYGLPSGHALLAVVVWGSVAFWKARIWFWFGSILLIVLISFSRIYLGVHFAIDVFAGWIIGIALLGTHWLVAERLEGWLSKLGTISQVLLGLATSILMLVMFYSFASNVRMALLTMGVLAGTSVGITLKREYLNFNVRGPLWRQILSFFLGVLVVFAIYSGLKGAYPNQASLLYPIVAFLHFGIIGLWVSFGAPLLFLLTFRR